MLFGPHMENFHDSVQVLVGRGGIQVKDAEHLLPGGLRAAVAGRRRSASLGRARARGGAAGVGREQRNVEQIARLLKA